MITLGLGYYRYINKFLQKEYAERLCAISQRQINTIEDTLSKAGKLLETFGHTRRMASLVPALQKAKKERNPQLQEELQVQCDSLIGKISSGFGFEDFIIFDMDGDPLYTASKDTTFQLGIFNENFKYDNLRIAFENAVKYLGTQVAKLDLESYKGPPAFFMVTPIVIEQRLLGVIAIRPSSKEIYRITNDYNGLDPTGETLVVSKHKEDFIFFNPSRFGLNPGLNQTVIKGSDPFSLLYKPLLENSGTGTGIDYRNEEVIASWNYLPSLHWGIMVKSDTRETSKPMAEVRRYAFFIGTLTTILLLFCSSFIAANLAQPFRFFSRTVQATNQGRLYFDFKSIKNRGQLELFGVARDLLGNLSRLRNQLEELAAQTISQVQVLASDVNNYIDTNRNLDQYLLIVSQKTQAGLMISQSINQKLQEAALEAETIAINAESSIEDFEKIRDLFYGMGAYSDSLVEHLEIINIEFFKNQDFTTKLVQLCDTINLIFVNAVIESKKAGPAGTGFGVIAQEIEIFSKNLFLLVSQVERSFDAIHSSVIRNVSQAQSACEKLKNNSDLGHRASTRMMAVVQQVQGVPSVLEGALAQTQDQEQLLWDAHAYVEMMQKVGDNLHVAFSQIQKEFSYLTKSCCTLQSSIQRFHAPKPPVVPHKE